MTTEEPERPPLLHGTRRAVGVALGCVFVGLGALGVLLPVLPTTPFLLLASYFFVRSSPRLNDWLLQSPLFGPFLRDWREHGAVRARVKYSAAAVMFAAVAASITWGDLSGPILGMLVVLAAIGLTVVLRLPVISDLQPQQVAVVESQPAPEWGQRMPPDDLQGGAGA